MEKIYFSKNIEEILEAINYSKLGDKVGIKIHFGEKGCSTYINPEIVKKVYEKVKKLGKQVSLIESNVLYRGSRTNSISHIKTAIEHGFDFGIDILDGERGEDYIEVKLNEGEAKIVKLGKGIKKYDSLIVLSHFKGHMMAGFGGAFKNMGMGIASRAGKLHMHSNIKPRVKEAICTACKVCIENCNAKAIKISPHNGKARIDPKICEGCALCIAVCPNGAIAVPWHGATKEELCKKIVDYAEGVMKLFPEKIIYINVLENITKDCDCMGAKQEPLMDDIGILLSYDPVAIDKASFDLAEKESKGKFSEITKADETQINYASEKKLGTKDYQIIDLHKVVLDNRKV
jgi:uncharacterized Fe-S center protein